MSIIYTFVLTYFVVNLYQRFSSDEEFSETLRYKHVKLWVSFVLRSNTLNISFFHITFVLNNLTMTWQLAVCAFIQKRQVGAKQGD